MSLVYPAKPVGDPPKQEVSNAITFVLSDDRIFYYKGEFHQKAEDGKPATVYTETTFGAQGVRKLLADENSYVLTTKADLDRQLQNRQIVDSTYTRKLIDAKKNKRSLKVLIKTDLDATCKNFIDLVDELKINDVGVVAPVDLTKPEDDLLTKSLQK
jgi:hypothetical protein